MFAEKLLKVHKPPLEKQAVNEDFEIQFISCCVQETEIEKFHKRIWKIPKTQSGLELGTELPDRTRMYLHLDCWDRKTLCWRPACVVQQDPISEKILNRELEAYLAICTGYFCQLDTSYNHQEGLINWENVPLRSGCRQAHRALLKLVIDATGPRLLWVGPSLQPLK